MLIKLLSMFTFTLFSALSSAVCEYNASASQEETILWLNACVHLALVWMYRWINQGVRRLSQKDPEAKKSYFQAVTGSSTGFTLHAHQLLSKSNNNLVLVHYILAMRELQKTSPMGTASLMNMILYAHVHLFWMKNQAECTNLKSPMFPRQLLTSLSFSQGIASRLKMLGTSNRSKGYLMMPCTIYTS